MTAAASAAAIAVVAIIVASPTAANVSLGGAVSQGFSARDSDDENDASLRSTTDLSLRIAGRQGRANFVLSPGFRALATTEEDQDPEISPSLAGSVGFQTPRHSISANLSVLPDFTSERDVVDASGRGGDDIEVTTIAGAAWSYLVDDRTQASLNGSLTRRTDIDEFAGSDARTFSYGGGASLRRNLTPTTAASVNAGVRRFESDDNDNGTSFSLGFGGDTQINDRLRLNGSVGPALTFRNDGDADFSVDAAVGASYAGEATRFGMSISQTVEQDVDTGALVNRTGLRASLGRTVNSRSRLGFSVAAALRSPFSDSDRDNETSFSLSPSYNYDLTSRTSLSVSYRLRYDEDEGDISNTVFLSISRPFTILP